MAVVSGMIQFTEARKQLEIPPTADYDFKLNLIPGRTYMLGLDQSTSCTGVTIVDTAWDIKIILDFKRDTGDKNAFYRTLKKFLADTFRDMKVSLVVIEKPVPTTQKMYTRVVLTELKGRVEEWISEIPSLSVARFDSIYPQTWKSLVIDKRKGTNRSNKKSCIADDICDKVPAFRGYYNCGHSKDYDAFDAFGILFGFWMYAFTPEGYPLICGAVEKRHTSLVCYRYLPREIASDKAKLNKMFGEALCLYNPIFRVYNERYNKFENIRMASSSNYQALRVTKALTYCTYTILPDSFMDTLKWQFDVEVKEDHVMLMYVLNKSVFQGSAIKTIKEVLPWNEEVVSL